jgi:YegS/Rv2252/BmrU family lipid kinase
VKKGLLIYNPRSGSNTLMQRLEVVLSYAYKKGILLLPLRLDSDVESKTLMLELLQAPWLDLVIASGGDGTLSYVAQLILQYRPELPMGIMPSGTCNDFAENLRLPLDECDCLDVIAEDNCIKLDVGQVNDNQIFLSTCAAGMFVNVSFQTNSELKKSLGPLAYYFQALGEMAHIRSFPMHIETENETFDDDIFLFLILNGSQAAGFANLFSKARMHDGLMDMIIIRKCPKLETAMLLFELLNRNVDEGKWLRHIQAREFRISSSAPVQTTLDGEEGLPLPFDIKVLHKGINVFVSRRR